MVIFKHIILWRCSLLRLLRRHFGCQSCSLLLPSSTIFLCWVLCRKFLCTRCFADLRGMNNASSSKSMLISCVTSPLRMASTAEFVNALIWLCSSNFLDKRVGLSPLFCLHCSQMICTGCVLLLLMLHLQGLL